MTATSEKLRFWVDMTLECVRRDHTSSISIGDQRGPFLTARALGMALAALHDAKVIAENNAAAVIVAGPPVPVNLVGADANIAAAAACCQTLLLRYPRQTALLNGAWMHWLDLFQLGAQGGTAEAAGRAYGLGMHGLGLLDPYHARRGAYSPTLPDPLPYEHVVPPNEPMQGYAGGAWGASVTPLLAARPAFPPPPGRVSATVVNDTDHYRDDFEKVARLGFDDRSRGRTASEELIGIYWGYDGPPELGTPPRLYMQVVLTVLDDIDARRESALTVNQELAAVAGAAVAMADAGIHAWFYKYSPDHMMWRPIVGIRKAVVGNGTREDKWHPLGRPDTNQSGTNPAPVRFPGTGLTPDFPAYPSGHATFGAAAFHVLRLFLAQNDPPANFGATGVDNVDFDFVSDEYNGRNLDPRPNGAGGKDPRPLVTKHYDSLWDAIVDNSISRVFLGVHWEFDGITERDPGGGDRFGVPAAPATLGKTGGVWLGAQIANAVAARIGVTPQTIAEGRM